MRFFLFVIEIQNARVTIAKIVRDAMKKIEKNNNKFLDSLIQHDVNGRDLTIKILTPSFKYFLLTICQEFMGFDINEEIINKPFSELLKNECLQNPLKLEILKVMLDYRMPINKFMCNDEDYDCPNTLTPLHFSVRNNNIDFVSM